MAGPSSRCRGGISCRRWRHSGFRCVAPDMRGYGRSSTYTRHEDFAQEADRRGHAGTAGRARPRQGGVDRPRLGQLGGVERGVAPSGEGGWRGEPLRALHRRRQFGREPAAADRPRGLSRRPLSRRPVGLSVLLRGEFRQGAHGLRGQHPQRREGDVPQGQSRARRQARGDRDRCAGTAAGSAAAPVPTCRAIPTSSPSRISRPTRRR